MFGEVEPAIVWMMDSFYKEHLKDRTEDTFIRPMFGDMSKMAELLTSSLTSHCLYVCFGLKFYFFKNSSFSASKMYNLKYLFN